MLPDRVSNLGPLTYESGALPIALRGPAQHFVTTRVVHLPKRAGTSLITEWDRNWPNNRIGPGCAGRA